jgi:hypothetical protein
MEQPALADQLMLVKEAEAQVDYQLQQALTLAVVVFMVEVVPALGQVAQVVQCVLYGEMVVHSRRLMLPM